jgi:hypothetical protein
MIMPTALERAKIKKTLMIIMTKRSSGWAPRWSFHAFELQGMCEHYARLALVVLPQPR